jgi:hypothetical protein
MEPRLASDLPARGRRNVAWTAFGSYRAMLPNPHPAVLLQPVPEGAILLHMEQEVYFGLNPVGLEVWQLLPPKCRDFDELCEELARRYPDVCAEALRNDVAELLDALTSEGLVIPAAAV